MSNDTVGKIKDKLSIVDVVGSYIKLVRAGATMRARCPFHSEKTPSFYVSPERGTYHCFGCNVGGDIFSFVQAIEGIDFKGALKVLAQKAGVQLEYKHSTKYDGEQYDRLFEVMEMATEYYVSHLSDEVRSYLRDRGVNENTITTFRVGYADNTWTALCDFLRANGFDDKEMCDAGVAKKSEHGTISDKFRNRVMFPISDPAGRVVAFSGRSWGPNAHPDAPKYLNSPETDLYHKSKILFGFDKAKVQMRKLGCAILVEGQMDLLSSNQAGWENTVAVSGTAFTEDHARIIKRMTENLVIALDGDSAGIKAAGRAARIALATGLNVRVAQLPDGQDPADLILQKGKDEWKAFIKNAKDIFVFLLDVLESKASDANTFRRNVESIVLPFLTDVQSPIAREQYESLISSRLHVSVRAVHLATDKLPTQIKTDNAQSTTQQAEVRHLSKRITQSYAAILFLESKGVDDAIAMRASLAETIGIEELAKLDAQSQQEKERLMFFTERLYGSKSPKDDFYNSISVLRREILEKELEELSEKIKSAENSGDQATVDTILQRSKELMVNIAQLHNK